MTGDLIYSMGAQGPLTAGQTYRQVCQDIAYRVIFGGEFDRHGELAQRFRDAEAGIIAGSQRLFARYAHKSQ